MENKKFIVTSSKETADILTKYKLQLVQFSDGKWFFINEPARINFEKIENAVFTNKIYI